MTGLPEVVHLVGNEYGRVAAESDEDATGYMRLDAARAAVADYDRSKAAMPAHQERDVRLVRGPVVDKVSKYFPVGWYINIEDA